MFYTNRNIFIDKVINRVLSRKNSVWSKISPQKAVRILYRGESVSLNDFTQRLYSVAGEINTGCVNKISASDHSAILEYANKALEHEFNILGSGWRKLEPIDWKTDFIHDFSWRDTKFYRNYELISPQGGRDIKVVWELSRCHHMLWLGEAYILTGDKKYASEVISQIKGWIEHNPLMYSVNWTCSMDVAIRAVNWIYSLSMISCSGLIEEKFIQQVMTSLYEHLFFIINNLEKTIPNSGNHYLSDIVGILFITPMFPNNRFAKVCYNFALKEYYRESLIELNDDGSNYENSISYHRLVTELFVYTLFSLKRRGQNVPDEVVDRISRATDYIHYYTKPNGLAPMLGDNDNGRLLPFVPRDFRDHRYLAAIGDTIFRGCEMCANGEFAFMGVTTTITTGSRAEIRTSKSGVSVSRKGQATIIVTNGGFSLRHCMKHGESGGTHTHPDNLSFELSLGNDDIFIDPGAYGYTSDPVMRNKMRSTESHNAVVMDNCNLAEFASSSVFVMEQLLSNITLEALPGSDSTSKIVGQYEFDNGHLRYHHQRCFKLTEDGLQINDRITAEGDHEVKLYFIIPVGIGVLMAEQEIKVLSAGFELSLIYHNPDFEILREIESYPVSPSYGVLKEGKRIVITTKIINEGLLKTSIQWRKRR